MELKQHNRTFTSTFDNKTSKKRSTETDLRTCSAPVEIKERNFHKQIRQQERSPQSMTMSSVPKKRKMASHPPVYQTTKSESTDRESRIPRFIWEEGRMKTMQIYSLRSSGLYGTGRFCIDAAPSLPC